jgi:molybdenum cofactor cytidylyltransferase
MDKGFLLLFFKKEELPLIFGNITLDLAEGAILAHTTRLQNETLPKGKILTPPAIAKLRAAGHTHIIAAHLDPGDVPEDEAARRLADALIAPGLARTRPGTGRANITATRNGLFRADATRIDAINALHEGLTIATLPDATPVAEGALLVTVKIIPFAIQGDLLAAAETLARAEPPLRLPPFRPLRTGLILTELPGLKASVVRGTIEATEKRVRALTGTLLPPRRVPHTQSALTDALRVLLGQNAELLLVAGASATVDRGDVGPAAIVAAGGQIDHFGMPVDPGNLICLGHIGAVQTLILPGCARSPALNGIDLVLARIFAAEPTAGADIARLGVGGLLKEFSARPAPRLRAAGPRRIPAIVLAAGLSSRMGPRNKLLIPDATGIPMIARTVDAVLASSARPIYVVVGHQADAITAALAGRPVTIVAALDYRDGLSASLRAGLAALPPEIAAALICLGDMPLLRPADIDRLLDAYDPAEGRLIIVPTHAGQRGNPVLWDRSFFPAMTALTGDTGARSLLQQYAEHVTEAEIQSDSVLIDFDTPETI